MTQRAAGVILPCETQIGELQLSMSHRPAIVRIRGDWSTNYGMCHHDYTTPDNDTSHINKKEQTRTLSQTNCYSTSSGIPIRITAKGSGSILPGAMR